jgi:hypothetical protein
MQHRGLRPEDEQRVLNLSYVVVEALETANEQEVRYESLGKERKGIHGLFEAKVRKAEGAG